MSLSFYKPYFSPVNGYVQRLVSQFENEKRGGFFIYKKANIKPRFYSKTKALSTKLPPILRLSLFERITSLREVR